MFTNPETNEALLIKKCPVCGGVPRVVFYRIQNDNTILLKRLECSACCATTPFIDFSLELAIEHWNEERDGNRFKICEYMGTQTIDLAIKEWI